MSIASDIRLLLIFPKNPWSRRVKHISWKKSANYEGVYWPFWERSRMDGKKPLQEYISVWQNLLCIIYFLLVKFSWLSYTDLHQCPFLSDANQVFKGKCSRWMNRTFAAIFSSQLYVTLYCSRRAILSNFLVSLPDYLLKLSCGFLLMEAIVLICFSVFKDQLTSISKYFRKLCADQVH